MKQRVTVALLGASMGVLAGCAVPFVSGDARGSDIGGVEDPAGANGGGGGAVDSGVAAATAAGASGDARHGKASKADGHGAGILPPLGPFDPTEPGFVVFDPCTEIPAAKLESIGLKILSGTERSESGYRTCGYEVTVEPKQTVSVGLSTSQISIENMRNVNGDKEVQLAGAPEEFLILDDFLTPGASCTVFLETVRGMFSVAWAEPDKQKSLDEKCSDALKLTNALI